MFQFIILGGSNTDNDEKGAKKKENQVNININTNENVTSQFTEMLNYFNYLKPKKSA